MMKSPLKIISAGLALSYLLMTACSKKQADQAVPAPVDPGVPPVAVTYAATVGPLFQAKCASCHAPGKSVSAIWTFDGYASVKSNAARIKNVVLVTKTMPKATSLSAAELKSVQGWFDQNMPE